ncbi:hypothetical protein K493DRAFT_86754 [Basidiobolus meristosporus CBS 931.73]|uniref:Galactosyl transferase GMA12/MNN10 family protein n=1 Tax=Basidiobolus meristosporus CBS 931.73 TaxID=1314790 RepID=A0A1Y1XGE1_9FUNG|nr:hypothetical protein K493DRAFT_86754 [Basidiobolus meristosporus CBS 931.73]|eukprot:ORX84783.1 hypothetical protein K493DRAFT_86754 [Basidiobolus meristosporus CBS 931.73]
MQKRYIGLIITSVACLIFVLTYLLLIEPSPDVSTVAVYEVRAEEIAIVMSHDENMPFYVPRGVENKREYAQRHGYQFFLQRNHSADIHESWSKITFTRKLMEENPQIKWFWWIDLDSIIMDPRISLEKLALNSKKIAAYKSKDIVISWDCNGLNTGSFFVRNSLWARDFLDTMIEYSAADRGMYGEQRVMQRLCRKDQAIMSHFSFPPLRTFAASLSHKCDLDYEADSVYKYRSGDFLVHFANCGPNDCHEDFEALWKRRVVLPAPAMNNVA